MRRTLRTGLGGARVRTSALALCALAASTSAQTVSIDQKVFTSKDEVLLHWSVPQHDDEHLWEVHVVALTPAQFEAGGVELTWEDAWQDHDELDEVPVGREPAPVRRLAPGEAYRHYMAAVVNRRKAYAIHDRVLFTLVHDDVQPRPGRLELGEESTFVRGGTVVFETPLEENERIELYRLPWRLHTGEILAGKYIETERPLEERPDGLSTMWLRAKWSDGSIDPGRYELHLLAELHLVGDVILDAVPIAIDEAPSDRMPFERVAAAKAGGLLDSQLAETSAEARATYPDLSNVVSTSEYGWAGYWMYPEPFGHHAGAIVSSTSSGYGSLVFGFMGVPEGWVEVDLSLPAPDPDTWDFFTWCENSRRWSLELYRGSGDTLVERWELKPGELLRRPLELPLGAYQLKIVQVRQNAWPVGTDVDERVLKTTRFEVGCPPHGARLDLEPGATYGVGQLVQPQLVLSDEVRSEDFTGELDLWAIVEKSGAPCPPCYRNRGDIDEYEVVHIDAREPGREETREGRPIELRLPTGPGEYVVRLYAPVPRLQHTTWGSYLRLVDEVPFRVVVPSSHLTLLSPTELSVDGTFRARIEGPAPHETSQARYRVELERDGFVTPGGAKVLPDERMTWIPAHGELLEYDLEYLTPGEYHVNLYYDPEPTLLDSVELTVVDPDRPHFPSLTTTTPDDQAPRYTGPVLDVPRPEACPACPGFDAPTVGPDAPATERGVEVTILAPGPDVDVPIDTIEGALPFRVEVSYPEPPGSHPGFATVRWRADPAGVVVERTEERGVEVVRWADPSIAVALEATDDPAIFQSGWLSIAVPAPPADAPLGSLGVPDAKLSARIAAELFTGRWDVAHTGGELDGATGMAVVGATGEHAVLWLGKGDGRRRYDSLEILATRDSTGGRNTLDIRFEDISPPPAVRPGGFGGAVPDSTILYVTDASDALTVTVHGQPRRVPIVRPEPPDPPESELIRVQLMARGDGARMAGAWSLETVGGALASGGQQTWSRGVRIDEAFALEDQRPVPERPTPPTIADFGAADDPAVAGLLARHPEPDRSTSYPFGERAHHSAKRYRRLFITGVNLPQVAADAIAIESGDPRITYTLDSLPGEGELDLFDRGWARARERAAARAAGAGAVIREVVEGEPAAAEPEPEELHAIVLRAELAEGVVPGAKAFTLNGAVGVWHLDFSDASALLSFGYRWHEDEDTGEGIFHPTDSVYVGDTVHVALDEVADIPREGLTLELSLNGELVASLHASRGGKHGDGEYRTGPLRLRQKGSPDGAPTDVGGPLVLEVEKGDELSVRIQNPTLLRTFPGVAVVVVQDEPNDLGATWKDALERTAECYGEGDVDFEAMTREKADEYSRFILTENMLAVLSPALFAFLDAREIEISKGDHAAAILIRDEFVAMMEAEIPRLRAQLVDEEEMWKVFLEARTSNLPFWNVSKVAGPDGEIWTLKDVAQVVSPGLAWLPFTEGWEDITVHDPNEENLRELVIRMVDRPDQWGLTPKEAHLTAFEITRKAFSNMLDLAEGAIDRAKKAGDRDVEELMLLAGQDADQVVARILPRLVRRVSKDGRETWEPDLVAQNFVKSLRIKGEALRALEQYGRIDDVYKALAVAAATCGTGFAVSATGAVATGAAIVMAGDVLDAIVYGGTEMQRALESEELLRYAEGAALVLGEKFYAEAEAARTEWYVAAIGVLLPGAAGAQGFGRLRSVRQANRGARVMLELKALGPRNLARLSASDLEDLAAYFTYLHRRRPGTRWQNLKNRGENLGQRELADLARFDEFFERAHLPPAPGSVPVGKLLPESHGKTTHIGSEHRVAKVEGDTTGAGSALPATETVPLPKSAYRNLPPGEVRINGDGPTLSIGDVLGEGATTTAFGVGTRPDGAYRVLRRGFSEAERRLDDGGYELLRGVEKGSGGLFEVTKIEGAWLVEKVSDPRYEALVGSYVTLVKRSQGDAKGLVKAAGGNLTPGQVFARDQVVRYLNRNGIAWTDAHFGNFQFEAIDKAKDQWRVVIFDTGGFFPAKGASELEQYRNARAIQQAFALMDDEWRLAWLEALASGDSQALGRLRRRRGLETFGVTAERFDLEALFGEIDGVYSGCPTMLVDRPFCRRLAAMPPELADALAARHTGKAPPLAPWRADDAPARTYTREEVEEAYRGLFEPPEPVHPPVDVEGSTIDVPPPGGGGNVFLFPDARRDRWIGEPHRVA